ncbi:MAG: hypothetical protein OEV42_12555 [Deltaproteobacteria bacterium]|nr:hypothetical protein [Deltaproteobacteria bacterium]
MKKNIPVPAAVKMLALLIILLPTNSNAATNEATYPGGGDIPLVNSGIVTVLSTNLQLVKAVFDLAGNCLASSPADANCNSSATSVAVGTGTELKFIIYLRNTSIVAATNIRFQDLLDDVEFTYIAGSIMYDASQFDTATVAAIFTAIDTTGTVQTDAFDGSLAVNEFAGIDTAASPDNLLVGGDTLAPDNDTVNIPANRTFAILFRAFKN